MKKFLTLMLLCFVSVMAWGASSGTVGNYAYSFNDDYTATISGFGYNVTGITELEIPETVTYQNEDYTVTKISHDMCNAPNYYSAILTEVIIPKTIVEIGYRAFNGQTSLSTIYCYAEEVPELTSSNGTENVFNNVTATVYVPAASVSKYQEAWGATYSGLTFEALDDETSATFEYKGLYYKVLSSSDLTVEVTVPEGTATYSGAIEIPEEASYDGDTYSVVGVGESAFENSSIESVVIPASVEAIGSKAFNGCTSLMTVTALPVTPPTTGDYAFDEDYTVSFGTLNVPCESLDAYSSMEPWCNFLYIIAIDCPEPTKFEVDGIYYQTVSSSEVEVTYGNSLWSSTSSYTGSISIPDAVTYESVPYKVIGIGEAAFYECASLSSISLPSTLQYIDQYAFAYSTSGESNSLTEIVIPESCTSIATYAFQYCTNLASVTLPSGLTEIPTSAFDRNSLTSIEIPAGVTAIGANAFRACPLTDGVTCYAVEPPVCTVQTGLSKQTPFTSVSISGLTLYVPSGSESAYREAEVWEDFGVIAAISDGGTSGGDHDGDYLTPEIMGFDTSNTGQQDITYSGAPSGTEYRALCHLGSGTYEGDFNLSSSSGKAYIWSSSSVGYLRKVTIEGDENDTSGTYLSVRASSEAFDGSSFSAFSSYGDELAQISPKDGGSVESSGDYKYFAVGFVNSWDSAKRFKAIELVWETEGGGDTGGQNFEYTVDPEEGTVTESFDVITLESEVMFMGTTGGGLVYSGTVNVYKDDDSEPYTTSKSIEGDVVSWTDAADTYLIITLEKAISEVGEYEVVIPAGTFYWFNNDNPVLNEEIILNYTFEGSSDTGSGVPDGYIVDPKEGEVPSLSVISLDTEGGLVESSSNFYDETKKAEFKVVNDETGATVATLGSWEIMMDDNTYHTWVEITLSNKVSEAGSYTVTIPEGVFLDATDYSYDANPAFTLSYTVTGEGGSHEVTFDPESGTTHSELGEFTVICEDGLGFNETNAITITRDGAELDIYVNAWEITDGTKATMDFSTDEWGEYSTSLTEAGEYVITIPAKFFTLGSDEVESEQLTITYYIGGSEEPTGTYSYVVDPVEGQVESLNVIEFSSDDEDVDGFLGNYEYALYTQEALVYDRSVRGEPITTATLESGGELDDYDSSIIITLKEEITDPGSYVVVIPEGSFYWIVDDEPILNEEINLSYYIEAPQGEYTFDPENGSELTSLYQFTVYYEDGIAYAFISETIDVQDEYGNHVAYDADCEDNYPPDDPYGDPISSTVTLNTEIVTDGTYTITIPEGYFLVGPQWVNCKKLTITYTIKTNAGTETGIGGININDENVEGIYSTSGQKLNKAQKGVNIIRYTDGSTKKVLISK